jgi:hypothetical protein
MLFAGHMGMGLQLRVQVGLQDRAGRPGIALGKICPVSRRRLRYRLMVATDTLNLGARFVKDLPRQVWKSGGCEARHFLPRLARNSSMI